MSKASYFPVLIFLIILFLITTGIEWLNPLEKQTDLKTAFLDGKLPQRSPVPYRFEDLYSSINFGSPFLTRIKRIPDTDFFLTLGVEGTVWKFNGSDRSPRPQVVLDISHKVSRGGSGLVGVAFHPNFNNANSDHYREIFLFYSQGTDEIPIYSRLSKFKFSEELDSILSTSEEILINQMDRSFEHDGGAMFFDNDGFLYVTFGDEGFPHTRDLRNSQSIQNKLFGGLLRIDVDKDPSRSHPIRRQPKQNEDRPGGAQISYTQNYFIPDDNPWLSEEGDYMEEYYAIGLRSPHTIFYDSIDQKIWVSDVGDADWEEITVLSSKSNAMWPYYEGPEEMITPEEEVIGIRTDPVHFYGRDQGITIIGGYVYRGDKFPDLNESFIFGDHHSGNVWAYNENADPKVSLITRGVGRVLGFYPCLDGGICTMLLNGRILRLVENPIVEEAPEYLSELQVFEDLGTLSPTNGLMPYEVNSPLWSDGSIKKRWLSLPDTSKITFNENDNWIFPVGTVFVKHFEMPINADSTKRLETRVFVIDLDKNGYGLTYRWDKTDSDAKLIGFEEVAFDTLEVQKEGIVQEQIWEYPTRSQCNNCHNENAGYVLGVKSSQINRPGGEDYVMGASNQIELWSGLNYFKEEVPASTSTPVLSNIQDTTYSLEHRVKSYLDANCSHCHQPFGVETNFDARFHTPLEEMKMIGHEAVSQHSAFGNKIVEPGELEKSELWIRDASLGMNKMPPLAKNTLDHSYLEVLREWIENNEPVKTEDEILIFPNPVQGNTFRIIADEFITHFALFDINGKKVPIEAESIDDCNYRLRINGDFDGTYFLVIQTEAKTYNRKIVML